MLFIVSSLAQSQPLPFDLSTWPIPHAINMVSLSAAQAQPEPFDFRTWPEGHDNIIASSSAGQVTTRTLKSDVEGHPHYAGQQDGGGEKKYEERHRAHLDRYYDDVIAQIGVPDALLILGPGEAKLELKERLSRSKVFATLSVTVEAADRLSEPQIVAKVKEHFRIDG